jgi:hypothetical protein
LQLTRTLVGYFRATELDAGRVLVRELR